MFVAGTTEPQPEANAWQKSAADGAPDPMVRPGKTRDGRACARPAVRLPAARRYGVRIHADPSAVRDLYETLDGRSESDIAFQDFRWVSLWYRSFCRSGGMRPALAVVVDETMPESAPAAERVAMIVPLVRRRRFLLPAVEFADRGVTDYNAVLHGPCMPTTPEAMRAAFDALTRSVQPFALLRMRKMPAVLGGEPNPFAMLAAAAPSEFVGWQLPLPDTEEALLDRLGRKKRKDLARLGRRLDALGDNRFAIAASPAERAQVFELIRRSQQARLRLKGGRSVLADAGYAEFYDGLVNGPEMASMTVMSALWVGSSPVAGVLGVRRGGRYIALPIGVSEDPEILRLGLGKVLLTETAKWAVREGLRVFDLSIGCNELKTWFHPEPSPLLEVSAVANGLLPRARRRGAAG